MWVKEVEQLSKIAETQPHTAYTAFTHGLASKWNYLLHVTDWELLSLPEILKPLESAIQSQFIPAITGQPAPGGLVQEMHALPVRHGGLGLMNPTASAKEQRNSSQLIRAPLVDQIRHQNHNFGQCQEAQQTIKVQLRSSKRIHQKEAKRVQDQLPTHLQRSLELVQEKGATTWLTLLPIEEHGFALHKAAFKDALSLGYGWSILNPPAHCTCTQPFSIKHALNCKMGGFPAVRHNEVRDITASLLSKVCHGVTIEPHLQPLSGESMSRSSAINEDDARLDVAAYGFWGGMFEKAFMDGRVFNLSAQSNRRGPLASVYRIHELKKKCV